MEKGKIVIVDTCIIQAAGHKDKEKSEAIIDCFNNLKKEGFELATSEICMYENLHGLWGQNAIKASEALQKFQIRTVSREVLIFASMLGGLYGGTRNDISVCDKIIGSTTVLAGGLILTANQDDFPPPYFYEFRYIPITYKKGSNQKTLDVSLLQPHLEIINRRIIEKDK